jgi:hypothetical protein
MQDTNVPFINFVETEYVTPCIVVHPTINGILWSVYYFFLLSIRNVHFFELICYLWSPLLLKRRDMKPVPNGRHLHFSLIFGWLWWWRSWWNEWFWQEKPKYSEKSCPDATLSTTNPTCQTRARTWAAAVGSQRLTASAMAHDPYMKQETWWYCYIDLRHSYGFEKAVREMYLRISLKMFVFRWRISNKMLLTIWYQ